MKEAIAPGLIGAGLFAIGYYQRRKVAASRAWPGTPGIVTSVSASSEYQRGGEDEADSVAWYPTVTYCYSVNGRSHTGNSIRFDRQGYGSEQAARNAVAAYPVGKAVEVFYDPARPEQAVLERRNSAGTVLLVLGGAILALAMAALLFGR